MKIIRKIPLITLALLTLNSCSNLLNGKEDEYFISQVSLNHFKLNQTITQDMINFIKRYYLVPKTTFYLQLGSSINTHNTIIEEALRNAGYGVTYKKNRVAIPFAYKIDFIDDNIIRATYNIGLATLSRLYRVEDNKVIPISAFTTRGLKKTIYQNNTHSSYNLKKAIVLTPVLNIRNRPSLKGKIVGKYYKDTIIYVEEPIISSGRKWSRVVKQNLSSRDISSNNKYVSSRYIQYIQ